MSAHLIRVTKTEVYEVIAASEQEAVEKMRVMRGYQMRPPLVRSSLVIEPVKGLQQVEVWT